jgi:hypothetical protein
MQTIGNAPTIFSIADMVNKFDKTPIQNILAIKEILGDKMLIEGLEAYGFETSDKEILNSICAAGKNYINKNDNSSDKIEKTGRADLVSIASPSR